MSNREVLIKLQDCIKGRLYRFRARNFYFGIYNGDKGFIGIRDKFGSRFLSTEYHWDSEVLVLYGRSRTLESLYPMTCLLLSDCLIRSQIRRSIVGWKLTGRLRHSSVTALYARFLRALRAQTRRGVDSILQECARYEVIDSLWLVAR